jgi:hypothetical protein
MIVPLSVSLRALASSGVMMKIFNLFLFLTLFVGVVRPGPGVADTGGVPADSPDYSRIVSGLPYKFNTKVTKSAAIRIGEELVESGVATHEQVDFVSSRSLRKSAAGNLYLKASLEIFRYTDNTHAESAWQEIQQKAHPDMGLTYAWDYLVATENSLYHLHAGCTFSEENFSLMMAAMQELLVGNASDEKSEIVCRCGGGCRSIP